MHPDFESTYQAVEARYNPVGGRNSTRVCYVPEVFETAKFRTRAFESFVTAWQSRPANESFDDAGITAAYGVVAKAGVQDRHIQRLMDAEINPYGTQVVDQETLYNYATTLRLARTIGSGVLGLQLPARPDIRQVMPALLTPEVVRSARQNQRQPLEFFATELSTLGVKALSMERQRKDVRRAAVNQRLQYILATKVPVENEPRLAALALCEPNPIYVQTQIENGQVDRVFTVLSALRGARSIARAMYRN